MRDHFLLKRDGIVEFLGPRLVTLDNGLGWANAFWALGATWSSL